MARYSGKVGYGHSVETSPGVHEDQITERQYYGDVEQQSRRSEDGPGVNNNLAASNVVSIVADPYANENFHAIRYIRWAGALWTVTNVEVKRPRLILRLGEVYNGPTP